MRFAISARISDTLAFVFFRSATSFCNCCKETTTHARTSIPSPAITLATRPSFPPLPSSGAAASRNTTGSLCSAILPRPCSPILPVVSSRVFSFSGMPTGVSDWERVSSGRSSKNQDQPLPPAPPRERPPQSLGEATALTSVHPAEAAWRRSPICDQDKPETQRAGSSSKIRRFGEASRADSTTPLKGPRHGQCIGVLQITSRGQPLGQTSQGTVAGLQQVTKVIGGRFSLHICTQSEDDFHLR